MLQKYFFATIGFKMPLPIIELSCSPGCQTAGYFHVLVTVYINSTQIDYSVSGVFY